MISVKNLTKSFGSLRAVDNVSFSIDKGEFYSLLGPNGAGKTTTIQMLSGLMQPASGAISVNGKSPKDSQDFKKSIGVVPQELSLYGDLTVKDNLRFWGDLYKVEPSVLTKRVEETIAFIELSDRKNDRVKKLSGGMKRRVNIASALLHQPPVLFMDEPTVGIDPQSRNMMYEMFEKLRDQGTTILYTSHYMEEVERLSSRIGIIDQGKIITEGTLDEIRDKHMNARQVVVEADTSKLSENDFLSTGFAVSIENGTIKTDTKNTSKAISEITKFLDGKNIDVKNIDIRKANLESIFLKLTGKALRE